VSGDDSLLYVHKKVVSILKTVFAKLWAPKGQTGHYGLGQASEGLGEGV